MIPVTWFSDQLDFWGSNSQHPRNNNSREPPSQRFQSELSSFYFRTKVVAHLFFRRQSEFLRRTKKGRFDANDATVAGDDVNVNDDDNDNVNVNDGNDGDGNDDDGRQNEDEMHPKIKKKLRTISKWFRLVQRLLVQ